MSYRHFDVTTVQTPKRPGEPCGDVVAIERSESATLVAICDGIGSGVRANLAANMCASRILQMIRLGESARTVFRSVSKTMNASRSYELPFAAFTIIQIRFDGSATSLSYEMPPPIYVSACGATILDQQRFVDDEAIIFESHIRLDPGDGLLAMSDGITQAGLGNGLAEGWRSEGVCSYVSDLITHGRTLHEMPESVHEQALKLSWNPRAHVPNYGDDCTAVMIACRAGRVVNILTGPPVDPRVDDDVVRKFLETDGLHVVCGATTAKIVARYLHCPIEFISDEDSMIAPPRSAIQGVDLVTEGAVTLNQTYNLIDEDARRFTEDSGVTRLCSLLREADRINITVGHAANLGNNDIAFKQQGILPRTAILPLLEQKLRDQGRLIVSSSV